MVLFSLRHHCCPLPLPSFAAGCRPSLPPPPATVLCRCRALLQDAVLLSLRRRLLSSAAAELRCRMPSFSPSAAGYCPLPLSSFAAGCRPSLPPLPAADLRYISIHTYTYIHTVYIKKIYI
ncbi:hypothetical protein FKM82_024861 [Ascaphus truei]